MRVMDLSVQALREVTFAPKRNGYDPTGVDDFIDDVVAGFQELEDKLRDANQRAEAAEAKASAAPVDGGPSTAMSASDIGKIWERAAAGAEATMEEARLEASRILDEARNNAAIAEAAVEDAQNEAARIREEAQEASRRQHEEAVQSARAEADNVLRAARNDAEGTRLSALQEAEAAIGAARNEAARLAEQAQGQLREEVSQLEHARDELRRQVDSLNEHIETELGRVRETLNGALEVVNQTQVGTREVPQTPPVNVPEARYAQGPEAFGEVAGFSAAQANIGDSAAVADYKSTQPSTSNVDNGYDFDSSTVDVAQGDANDNQEWHQENEWTPSNADDANQGADQYASAGANDQLSANDAQSSWNNDNNTVEDEPFSGRHGGYEGGFGDNSGLNERGEAEPTAWEVMQRNDDMQSQGATREDNLQADVDHIDTTQSSNNDWPFGGGQQQDVQPAPWEQQDNTPSYADIRNDDDEQANRRSSDAAVNGDNSNDEDYDPFLAELRRAVHDEGPLGPRNNDDDSSIDSLYADNDNSDNDSRGFFRRRK